MAAIAPSLAFHEPSIITIAILSGFLLLLNTINYGLDKLVYCGLIGQVFLGIAWGAPGAKWLSDEMEHSMVQLGYLGLILIVYEGGLSTSFKSLKANLLLSIGVAVTGIAIPMSLSFTLNSLIGATPLQAFAAGAALCSTSLGTTFTVLGTSGLTTTRMGVVLTSAAMMDDVVGLIMVQVVSNLGGSGGSAFNAVTVVRPVLVSLGFATVVPAACKLVVGPITLRLNSMREQSPGASIDQLLPLRQTALVIHTCWLFGLIVGGAFAGTSTLLAAYIAGATISWWDSEVPHLATRAKGKQKAPITGYASASADQKATIADTPGQSSSESPAAGPPDSGNREPDAYTSGIKIYERYYSKAVEHVLKPFFFASVGFSIPITRMFSGPIVWRGIVYTILMMAGKLICSVWLLPFASPLQAVQRIAKKVSGVRGQQSNKLAPGTQCAGTPSDSRASNNRTSPQQQPQQEQEQCQGAQEGQTEEVLLQPSDSRQAGKTPKNASPKPEMPVSVYPACILAFAMVARGEIGYLISALAESTGIFSGGSGAPDNPSEMFLIVTWAITLCTIVGPICVGLLVNRVKRLEAHSGKGSNGSGRNVLGAWGVE